MADHKKRFDPEDSHAKFQAGNNLRCHHIAGHSRDKDMSDRLIKNQFYWYARVSTGQYCRKRLLFIDRPFFHDYEIMRDRCQLICGKALDARE